VKFLSGFAHAVSVGRVNNEDQTLGTCRSEKSVITHTTNRGRVEHTAKVMPPERTDLVLTTDIPDVELDVLVGDALDVEANGGNGGNVLAELELVEDGGLSGGVETEHEEAHFLGSEDLAHHLGQLATHGCDFLLGIVVCMAVEGGYDSRRRGR
jgi:hypothetical protein